MESQLQKHHLQLAEYFHSKNFFLESIEEQRQRAKFVPPTSRLINIRKVIELPFHLFQTKQWLKVESLFTNLSFLEAKTEAGLINELVLDFLIAYNKLPTDSFKRHILRLIRLALLRDLQFIKRHPTFLFQCLWNTCWWYDCPELESHYIKKGSNDVKTEIISPWLQSGIKLFQILSTWKSQKEILTPGFRWIRSLRPPSNSLEERMVVINEGINLNAGTKYLALSSSGDLLIRANDHDASLWNTNTNQRLTVLANLEITFLGVSFYRENISLAFGIKANKLIAFNLTYNCELVQYDIHSQEIACLGISSNGEYICVGFANKLIYVWTCGGKLLRILSSTTLNEIKFIAIASNGKFIAVLDNRNKFRDTLLKLWDINSSKLIYEYEIKGSTIAFSPESIELLVGGSDGEILILEINSLTWKESLEGHLIHHPVRSIVFSMDNNWIASAGFDMRVCIWNRKTSSLFRIFQDHSMTPEVVALSYNGRIIASGAWEDKVFVREIDFLPNNFLLSEHSDWIDDIIPSRFSSLFATTSEDNSIRIWDSITGIMTILLDNSGSGFAFSPNSEIYATSNLDGDLTIRLSKTNAIIEEIWFLVKHERNQSISFSHDGQLIAFTADNDKIVIMNWGTMEMIHVLPFNCEKLSISPDGQWLACFMWLPNYQEQYQLDNNNHLTEIHIFNIKTGAKEKTLQSPLEQGFERIIFSEDNKCVIFSSLSDIYFWDWQNDKYLKKDLVTVLDYAISRTNWAECDEKNEKLFQLIINSSDIETLWLDEKENVIYAYQSDLQNVYMYKNQTIIGNMVQRLEVLHIEGNYEELQRLPQILPSDYWSSINSQMEPLLKIDQITFSPIKLGKINQPLKKQKQNEKEEINFNNPLEQLQNQAELLELESEYNMAIALYAHIEYEIEECLLDEKLMMAKCLLGQARILKHFQHREEALEKAKLASIFSPDIDQSIAIQIDNLIQTLTSDQRIL